MTTKELIEKIDGETKGEIIEQAYDLGFKDGMLVKNMLEDDNIRFLSKIANGEDTNSSDIKIDNKSNPSMPKDYDKFTFDPQLAEEYARKAADFFDMSLEEFVKANNKPIGVINNPKYIVVNGALYEKIDDSVMIIANEYI